MFMQEMPALADLVPVQPNADLDMPDCNVPMLLELAYPSRVVAIVSPVEALEH